MKLVLKICMVLVLGTGILLSSPLTGAWQIDESYTTKQNKAKYRDILTVTMKMLSDLDIADNNVIVAKKVGLHAKLETRGDHYALVADGNALPLYLLDAGHMKLIQIAPDRSKYALYYSRTKTKHQKIKAFTSSQIGFKFNRVYRSKKIDGDYRFMLFTKKGELYYVQTDRINYLTANEIRSKNIMKILKQKGYMGSSFANTDRYIVKNGNVHTLLGEEKLEVINSEKFKYYRVIYKLQKQ